MIGAGGRRRARRAALCLAIAAALSALAAQIAAAAPADLAQTFGDHGIVQLESSAGVKKFPADASARAVIGPEDEVIVLTSTYACAWQFECDTELTLARYDAAGKRDASFGMQLRVHEGPERHPFDLAVGPDAKAVVAAYDGHSGEEGSLRVFRFDRSGRLDPSFGAGGETAQPLRPGYSAPVAVAVQPDGKVVLTTEGSRVEGGQELRIARYLTNGELDPSFGGSGEVDLTLSTQTRPADLLLDPRGGITVAGPYCCVGGTTLFGGGFSLARVLADGSPDSGLAGAGRLLFPTPGAEGTVAALALAPDGGTLVLFEERTETVSTVDNLVKLLPDGSVDAAFGNAGRLRLFNRVGGVNPTTIAVDGKGRIVGGGRDDKVAAFRLRPDGSVDRTFNGGRRVLGPFGGTALSLAFQSSGRIVVLYQSGCCQGLGFGLIAFGGGTDHARCQGHRATIVGTRKADQLVGTKHRDVIVGLDGRDEVRGSSGADLICGGKGRDKLLGGPGHDEVRE
jgi:uncharacterized delta-60 repeat protein